MDKSKEEQNSRDVSRFVASMKQEIAKIPPYLSPKEYRARAERCRSIAESYDRFRDKAFERKKYQLLAEKYDQLSKEAEMRKRGIIPAKTAERRAVIVEHPQTEIRVEPIRELSRTSIRIMIIGGFLLAVFFFLSAYMKWFSGTLDTLTLNMLGGFFLLLAVIGLVVPRGRDI